MDIASADCPTTLILATMERLKTSEAQTKHTETPLCDKCAVMRIDDKKWGRRVEKHDGGRGSPFVIFPKTTNPLHGHLEEIELAYEREDIYPDLPIFEQGSINGCEFCKLLRESLRERSDLIQLYASHKSKGQGVARIYTRKISYRWANMSLPSYCLLPAATSRRVILQLDFYWINDAAPPTYKALFFDFFSDQGPLASWLSIQRGLPPASYLHSEVLSQIKGWLVSTDRYVDFSNEAPTRLIDVGPSDGTQQPRLIVSREDLHTNFYGVCSYVALSHCWGEPGDLQLKTTNCVMERFRREIPLESCPETFRDAIKFVRAIGLQYLWIDALCIIQDDQLDWERESVKMCEVYSRAHLTIVPLKSESPKVGFLERGQRPRMEMHFISTLNDGINGSFWLQPTLRGQWDWQGEPNLLEFDQETSRWVNRAWTLQESQFSRRLLYFGNNGVSLQTYDGHQMSDNGYSYNRGTAVPNATNATRIRSCLEASNGIERAWAYLIQNYTDRELTFLRDRLPAISGLASLIQSKTKDVYLAGLWLSHLHVHLHWQTNEHPKIAIAELVQHLCDPVPYTAPSWSWARMKQRVDFPMFNKWKSAFQVLDLLMVPEGCTTFGAISYGHLVLRGKMYHLKNHSVKQTDHHLILSVEEQFIAFVEIDGALDDGEELHVNNSKGPFRCDLSTGPLSNMVMFRTASAGREQNPLGLLLIPKGNGPDWLRIGTFYPGLAGTLRTFFDSCEAVDVKIV